MTNKFQSGNKAAAKPDADKKTSTVVLQMTQSEKSVLVKAAFPSTVAAWVRDAINLKLGVRK